MRGRVDVEDGPEKGIRFPCGLGSDSHARGGCRGVMAPRPKGRAIWGWTRTTVEGSVGCSSVFFCFIYTRGGPDVVVDVNGSLFSLLT